MTQQEIKVLVAYNRWASQRFFDVLSRLPAELYAREMKSSHGGIHGTLAHIVDAERHWLTRWLRSRETTTFASSEVASLLAPDQLASLSDLRVCGEKTGGEMARFLETLTDQTLQEAVTTTNAQGGTIIATYWQMIQHVVNHSSYHRGQIVTMLRQLGVQPPSTGLMRFYLETGKSA
jgi:uncharacterized damage-inducible protein DinB